MTISEDRKNRLEEIRQKILSDREVVIKAMETISLKDNSEHALAGPTLAKYIDSLSKLNAQLLDIEKLLLMKDKVIDKKTTKEEEQKQRKLLADETITGTALEKN